ncbi:Holliday junction branch migration protein RuvA [Marinomonas mediterranea]|uniref:Holliday junction branch migration complex subunit RuvA n=1 Tax=Marinomonas mediterranea (strain ATCC 700492 / JCM 21426 / NBRC 103028 / MMB-1) TaxID=717774 RepID=F2K2T5_MARM1|nr:Holliday junction branch migration protein RuvA [Marinomonas mediterranea]ADZ91218.1 Holliday junction ATP-dependent DNA helicase ruvA [Marinomonas mediterranea MMB-1]WCN09193.1 Holliday junction branch migration protein RuvA [Marinomonas mediterranea]WCN17344.1 Holliday junction branch migration protein RuvA [Marinomonas mediterranea MMB-1]
MISRIVGTLIEKMPPELLVDVNGIGYEVYASMTTIYDLASIGETVVLHTHLQVKEDSHTLYGFHSKDERAVFRVLIKVNGIGPKMALAILSSMSTSELIENVQESNVDALVKIPGVGKKTAERLIIELRDKLGQAAKQDLFSTPKVLKQVQADPRQEAEAALVALGYKPQEASKAVAKVPQDGSDSETIIKAALKGMLR